MLALARGLAERGHQQLVVCSEGSPLESRALASGLRVFGLPAHDFGHAHRMLQLRQHLLAAPADILHAHDGRGQTISWLASWGLPVRRVASRRVTFLPDARARHRFIYGRTCHAVVGVSQYIRGLLIDSGVPARKIEVIPDGIDIPPDVPTTPERAKARWKWSIPDDDFVIGMIGGFTPEKGLDIAIKAVRLLVPRLPSIRLMLAGEAPQEVKDNLSRHASDVRGRIQFLGHLEGLREFLAAIDLLVMPSRAEGLGSAALLAMAHGRPVVASRVGGLPEVVEDGVTGWLVPPGSAEELALAIHRAASDATRIPESGVAARERVRQFSTDIMVRRTEKLYFNLVAR